MIASFMLSEQRRNKLKIFPLGIVVHVIKLSFFGFTKTQYLFLLKIR